MNATIIAIHNIASISKNSFIKLLLILRQAFCKIINAHCIELFATVLRCCGCEFIVCLKPLLLLLCNALANPRRLLNSHMTPYEWVTVYLQTTSLAPINNRLRRRSAPVWLKVWLLAVVPPLFGIPLLRQESLVSLLQLQLTPVECYGSTIEECSEGIFIDIVILLFTELIPVERACAKSKVRRNLLDVHLCTLLHIAYLECSVTLTILLDIGIDASLNILVPILPILSRHYFLGILRCRARNLWLCHS